MIILFLAHLAITIGRRQSTSRWNDLGTQKWRKLLNICSKLIFTTRLCIVIHFTWCRSFLVLWCMCVKVLRRCLALLSAKTPGQTCALNLVRGTDASYVCHIAWDKELVEAFSQSRICQVSGKFCVWPNNKFLAAVDVGSSNFSGLLLCVLRPGFLFVTSHGLSFHSLQLHYNFY